MFGCGQEWGKVPSPAVAEDRAAPILGEARETEERRGNVEVRGQRGAALATREGRMDNDHRHMHLLPVD